MDKGRLFIFSAASGTGKTSLAKALIETMPNLAFLVSHTTRSPRAGEQHGVHYYFVNQKQFDEMVAADRFLEHATVFGNFYGTSRAAAENMLLQGKNIILDIDWQGARAIKVKMPESVSIFILPPSRAELKDRLIKRGQDTREVIESRMRQAMTEMAHYSEFDHVVVNDDFDAALDDLRVVITGVGTPRPLKVDIRALLSE